MPEVKRFSKNGTILKTRSHTDPKAGEKLLRDFFTRDVLMVAPDLIGKIHHSVSASYVLFQLSVQDMSG